MYTNDAHKLYLALRYSFRELTPEIHAELLTQYEELCKPYNSVLEEPLCKTRIYLNRLKQAVLEVYQDIMRGRLSIEEYCGELSVFILGN